MKNSRFIRLLQSFDKKEINAFGYYLQCFHPKKERAIQLYQYLANQYPKFRAKHLTSNMLTQAVYQQTEPQKKNILNLLSYLYGWAKDFLIWQHQLKNPLKKDLLWLEVLNTRQMDHEFKLQADLTSKSVEQQEISNIWDYLDRLNLYHQIWAHPSTRRHTPNFEALEKSIDSLNSFYRAVKMNYDAEQLNRNHFYQNLAGKKPAAQANQVAEEALIMQVARLQLKLIKEQQKEDYLQLKKIFLTPSTCLSKHTKSVMLQYLINFTAVGIRGKHKPYFYEEAFELYNHGIKTNLLSSAGPLPAHTFSNVISVALWMDKTKWAENFIDKFAYNIDPPVQKQTELMARALVAFKKKDHNSSCFTELQAISYTDPQHAIRVKTLVIRNLYEAKEDKAILLLFNNAFKKYLTRNKNLTGQLLAACLNFVVCFRYLVMNRMTNDEFEETVKKTTPLILVDWFLSHSEKLDGSGR